MRALTVPLAALVLLTGCRAGVRLTVDVDGDGSGVVTLSVELDDEALEGVGAAAFRRVRVADLEAAGWEVELADRSAVARKRFRSPAEVPAVVGEVSGPLGPFREFRVERDAGPLRTTYDFDGRVDLRDGAAGALDPADPVVRREFAREDLDVEAVRAELERLTGDALDVSVRVALPGGDTTWEAPAGEVTELEAGSTSWASGRLLLLLVAVALAAGGVVLVRGVGVRGRRRR